MTGQADVSGKAPGPAGQEAGPDGSHQFGLTAAMALTTVDALALALLFASLSQRTGDRITVTDSVAEAVAGAGFIHTDVWCPPASPRTSGTSASGCSRAISSTRAYRRNPAAGESISCTVCPRSTTWITAGLEVTDEVFQPGASIVFDQAEIRLHTTKAVLVATLG
jgi:ornithine carbamoyltransferase